MSLNIPNILTLMRVVLIPIMMFSFYVLPGSLANYATVIIYALASITDWLDGFLARRLNQTSDFGKFLDPVADKLIVSVALVMLAGHHASWVFVLPASIIVGREITISALREWMADIGQKTQVAVSTIGKIKTAAQMLAIGFLLYEQPIGDFPVDVAGLILLYAAAILTLWSMFIYLKASWDVMSK